jgi:hypothetical protein
VSLQHPAAEPGAQLDGDALAHRQHGLLRLADHDGQPDGRRAGAGRSEEDVLPELEAEPLVVGIVPERAGLEIYGAVLGVGLPSGSVIRVSVSASIPGHVRKTSSKV